LDETGDAFQLLEERPEDYLKVLVRATEDAAAVKKHFMVLPSPSTTRPCNMLKNESMFLRKPRCLFST